MPDLNRFEKSVNDLGIEIIKKVSKEFNLNEDQISKEIEIYKRKYGKRWFKKFTKHSLRLAQKEQDKLKRN